jgi:predicted transcriptional regulator
MCINRQLKAELRQLAHEEGYNLSGFVTSELDKLLPMAVKNHTSRLLRRRVGRTYFMMRITEELKAKLEKFAAQDHRTLTDFIEIALHGVTTRSERGLFEFPATSGQDRNAVVLRPEARRARTAISMTPHLKAALERLANKDYRTLTNFIELNLHHIVNTRQDKWASRLPRRQPRDSRLTVRVSSEFKARLQMLADREYRTITDCVEVRLRQAIATRRKVRSNSSPTKRLTRH